MQEAAAERVPLPLYTGWIPSAISAQADARHESRKAAELVQAHGGGGPMGSERDSSVD
eukprot:CAMPEP_0204589504 /NCGR_PEP_ID=MMETSP0661-20131031/49237_1 /ASSEMBLY_ACC=CAM_ASM_000606 /TAXON_ID=109239 /ORGANISM="Alexandrium margalefi, Strain AMGDE01CS-322" /LENGTH=57 /DNA_ID=CAMNT_0051599427 /DNA_START=87 /DNA_END=261 /DNA_ORIENTATION=-